MLSGTQVSYYDLSETPGKVTRKCLEVVSANGGEVFHDLAFDLLWTSTQISTEAASTFYRLNTFFFEKFGEDTAWAPLYAFLTMIGVENRGHLRNITIQMHKPIKVWQHPDGTRSTMGDWRFRKVIPQSTYLPATLTHTVNGPVDHLDPGIEACFRLFGMDGSEITLVLALQQHILPGVQVMFDDQHSERYNLSLDVPIIVEKCRRDLTVKPGTTRRVRVLWKGECFKERFLDKMKLITECGWVVVDSREGSIIWDQLSRSTVHFTLRRNDLI